MYVNPSFHVSIKGGGGGEEGGVVSNNFSGKAREEGGQCFLFPKVSASGKRKKKRKEILPHLFLAGEVTNSPKIKRTEEKGPLSFTIGRKTYNFFPLCDWKNKGKGKKGGALSSHRRKERKKTLTTYNWKGEKREGVGAITLF